MADHYEIVVVGSGEAGKYLAWNMTKAGHRTALVERKLIGGSCPNIACLPSKNVVHGAKVASYMRRAAEFGAESNRTRIDMSSVYRRKQAMVDGLVSIHLERFRNSGVELSMGHAAFTDERTVEVSLNSGGTRTLTADKLFLSLGRRTAVPGLSEANAMTYVEDLQRLPGHLIGAGYIALEFAQAFRRFGSTVTIIQRGQQLASGEDEDTGTARQELFHDEGINVLLNARVTTVAGLSRSDIQLDLVGPTGASSLRSIDLLIATGRFPNTHGIGLEACAERKPFLKCAPS